MTALALKRPPCACPRRSAQHWRALAVLGTMAALVAGRARLSVAMQGLAAEPELPGRRAPTRRRQRLQAAAAATSATQLKADLGRTARWRSTRRSRSPSLANPAARPVHPRRRERRRPAALARLPDRRHLLRGGERAARRPARGRPGGAEPRPPSGLSQDGLRRRLRRRAALDRLPVQLHLRRLAAARRRWPAIGSGARGRRRRRRSTAMSMRRSAGRPIITPIMSCLIGPRPWSSRPMSACTSSIAGAAAGAGPAPSSPAMPGSSRRSPGAAASASRCRSEVQTAALTLRDRARRRGGGRGRGGRQRQRRQLPARGAAPLRAVPARHRQCPDRRARPRRPRASPPASAGR